jgi:4-diphosphocytidyl-2-C-methyl-D-erythritol kinase
MDAKPPISHASGQKVCIVKPDIGLSTPLVFQNLNYEQLSPLDPDKTLLPAFLAGIETVPDEYFVNDLEAPAFYCVPELAELKNELQQEGFDHVLMSGSGTSIFCLGEPSDKVAFDTNFGQRAGLQVFYTEFISRESDSWYERPTRQ